MMIAPFFSYSASSCHCRGPIWIPINYLAVRSLNYYSLAPETPPSVRERVVNVYSRLRHNLIQTIIGQYNNTGYFWEQYDDQSGKGIRGHPFNGWTSLVVNIMAERY
jgi:mannosyl-oligosaccharide glucosidase